MVEEGIAVFIDRKGICEIRIKEGRVCFDDYAELAEELMEDLNDLNDAVIEKVKMIADAKADANVLIMELETPEDQKYFD